MQLLIMVSWIVTFVMRGFTVSAVPIVGQPSAQGSVLGNIMLNYAYITTVPSWVNEKRRSSNVKRVLGPSVCAATLCYLLIGILGALAFPGLGDTDVLTAIAESASATILDKISVYLFPLIAVASSIPIFSIIIRYNLVENQVLSLRWANVVSVVLPWVLVIPLTAGNSIFNAVSAYTSLLFQLPINLCIPFIIYYLALRRKATLKPCLCEPGPCEHDSLDDLAAVKSSMAKGLLPAASPASVVRVSCPPRPCLFLLGLRMTPPPVMTNESVAVFQQVCCLRVCVLYRLD